jgi:ABC-2 type transport system ATP-binding protein
MRQRLGLAAALLGDPEVLLLDEPANGLDPAGIAWLRATVRGLAAEGRAVVVASHVLGEVTQTADQVVVVSQGKLRFAGRLSEIGETSTALESAFLRLTAAAGQ